VVLVSGWLALDRVEVTGTARAAAAPGGVRGAGRTGTPLARIDTDAE
jgi:hypothetical protein